MSYRETNLLGAVERRSQCGETGVRDHASQGFNLTPVEDGMQGSKVGIRETLSWGADAVNLITYMEA